ncbi:MAG: molybdenum cofactor guanylyltransferase [Spirulina sp. SIO3F2]|nr:molybdenum cofactor guanylyltransferase [Spirulina sp. SIO3F2]
MASLILAGGKSTRMGQDKASLMLQGQPLLLRVAQVATQVSDRCHIITPWPERYQTMVQAQLPAVQWIREHGLGHGPLVGFAQGLVAIAATESTPNWILLLACDLPNLDPQVLGQWCGQLPAVKSNILAMVPKVGDRWEPLCAFYRPAILPFLEGAIAQNQTAFQALLNHLPVQPIPLTAEQTTMLYNCNTPTDWQTVIDRL